ncbi:MotA/TolQ/ExbB proton channel family protein [uncultured Psychroserpens sp.]|uniref:MotA/TolQ/ExbB proton channel family protein n=1 Tax=uncultured Psychroserpens sp. TaxID=255436 RepID=UPI0026325546|nr:MotA/TolQ/ExbB proton channel family protein [uncultured Psychroserpens sp.]
MNTLTLTIKNFCFMPIGANIYVDGGPLFMTLILICLLTSLAFVIRGFLKANTSLSIAHKSLKLAIDFGLLGLVMGFFASIIGLISAFDTLEAMGNAEPSMFAAGLKISLLTATFGLFTFIITRIGIIALRLKLKSEDISE